MLYEHQRKAFETYKDSKYFALFFEPGLGKTLTLITILKYRYEQSLVTTPMIVVPKPLISTWVDELNQWWPDHLPISVCPTRILPQTISLVNIDKFSHSYSPLCFSSIDFFVIDEATKIKNMSSIRTKYILKKTVNIPYKAILTGTPFTSSPLSLYPLLKFLSPSLTPYPFSVFKNYFSLMVTPSFSRYPILINESIYNQIQKLTYIQAQSIFHVGFEDYSFIKSHPLFTPYKHIDEIPTLCERVGMFAKASSETSLTLRYCEDKKFITLTKEERLQIDTPTAFLMALRQKASRSLNKLCLLFEDLDIFLEDDQSVIIVTYFISTIDFIDKQLTVPHCVIKGSTPVSQRTKVISDFNSGKVPVLIASLSIIAYGLNLQTSHIMLFYDSLYSYEDYVQCKKRIDRIGQTAIPRYFHYILRDSVEEKIYKLISVHESINTHIQELCNYYDYSEYLFESDSEVEQVASLIQSDSVTEMDGVDW